jgi:hypothetical protein
MLLRRRATRCVSQIEYIEAVELDADSLSEVMKRVESFEDQAKENRRFHFATAQLCRVLYARNAASPNMAFVMKWGLSLISYAKLHQEDPVKHSSLHKDAGHVIEQALQGNDTRFDEKLQSAFKSGNGNELAFFLRLMMDSPTMFRRARRLGANVTVVDLHGSSAVTDFMLMTLADICPLISSMSVKGCRRVSDQTLHYIGPKLGSRLKTFNAAGCDAISDAGIIALAKIPAFSRTFVFPTASQSATQR